MKQFKVGLQLFSIREALEADFEGTLQKVKDIGYDYVEFCNKYFFDKSGKEVKEILDKIGLQCFSVHQDYWWFSQDKQNVINNLVDVGAKYCTLPWFSPDTLNNDLDSAIKDIGEFSASARNAGLKFYYHNHYTELNKIDDEYILDKILNAFPDGEVNPQFDVAFFLKAKEDPAEYIRKYAGRVDLVHLKDAVLKEEDGEIKLSSTSVGEGALDIPAILKACEEAGTEYIIVEQSSLPDFSLDGVKASRDYLKSLGL